MRRLGILAAGLVLVVGACAGAAVRRIEAGPVALDPPSMLEGRQWTWHVAEGGIFPSGDRTLVFLSSQPLVEPCRSEGGATRCGSWPIARLVEGGLVVAVRTYGGPGRTLPAGAPTTVGGREARLVRDAGDASCREIGGAERVRTIVPGEPGMADRPGSFSSWIELDACLGGPAAASAFDVIVGSVRWLTED